MLNHLFEAKKTLYPQKVKGRFRSLKSLLNTVFLSIYFLLPFIRFSRFNQAPNQAILIDLPGSKAYFFFIEIWPQEVYYLAGILIIAAVALFFITSLFGRIWCGYACFQTVWTDIFIALECFFQGDRNERILLNRKQNFNKFWKKFLTHSSWIIFSLLTGYGFVSYFNDAIILTKNIFHGQVSLNILGWILGIAAMTYLMAGFAREHVCTYMCPYSRFQSAMFDQNTLIISYDARRGEPRAKMKQDEDFSRRGHCIDCKQCVVVCPTGIDIRNGLQMECIACGLCVDACDNIMTKIGLPKGLIRYDTLSNLEKPADDLDSKKKFRILKPRTFFYAAILTLFCGLILRSLILKPNFETSVIADRNPVFVILSDGSVRNGYNIKIVNKTFVKKTFQLKISEPAAAILKSQAAVDLNNLEIAPGDILAFKAYVILSKELLAKNQEGDWIINFIISDAAKKESKNIRTIFISK